MDFIVKTVVDQLLIVAVMMNLIILKMLASGTGGIIALIKTVVIMIVKEYFKILQNG